MVNITHTNKTYKFSNFEELYRAVPADRIEECMYELCQMLITARQVEDLIVETARASGEPFELSKPVMAFPAVLEWIDDGKGELDLTLTDPAGTKAHLNLKMDDIH